MGKLKSILPLIALTLIPTIFVWLPFFLRLPTVLGIPVAQNGMATIIANYDGPLYLVVAKTLYNIEAIKQNFQFPLPVEYYAAHFPLYPILIRLTSLLTGYPYSMLAVTIITSFFAIYFFNKLIKNYVSEENALWLTFVFSIFPARFLIVRSIGSPEPLFIAAIIASIYFFQAKRYFIAGFFGLVAQLTKSPAILLFIALFLAYFFPQASKLKHKFEFKAYPLLLIPVSLLGIFTIYKLTFNDFFAYFNSGDNIHLMFPPFQIFNSTQNWVGTFWLEEIIFIYFAAIAGFLALLKKNETTLASFVGVFFLSTIFVSHRDLMRYSLPLVPFLFVAFSDYLVKKEFKIALVFLIIPIYLFSLSFISQNAMPISDWSPFL